MSTITTINSGDQLTASRSVINTNFSNLNSDKSEKANNLSDLTVPNTALNNILPSQSGKSGKVLGSDGANSSWVDPSGASKATNLVQGVTALSVVAADPLLPNAVGDNDPRVPTQAENDALVGTGTPSSSNKYVTKDTNDLNELLTNKSTSGSLGTSNTLYPSQNAVKTYVDAIAPIYKSSVTTRTDTTASGNQTIAHGVGRIPKFIRITCMLQPETGGTTNKGNATSIGTYDGTTTSSVYEVGQNSENGNVAAETGQSSTNIVTLKRNKSGANASQVATVTFDATNITLAWTLAGIMAGNTINILWEAIG